MLFNVQKGRDQLALLAVLPVLHPLGRPVDHRANRTKVNNKGGINLYRLLSLLNFALQCRPGQQYRRATFSPGVIFQVVRWEIR